MSRQRRRLRPGRIVALAGLVTLLSTPFTATAAAQDVTAITEVRTAVVLLDYPNAPYPNVQQRRTELENLHFGTTGWDSAARYFREASDGRITFVPVPGKPAVLGPLQVTAERTCDGYKIRKHAIDALAAQGIPKSSYDAISVHVKRMYSCPWGAMGWTWDGLRNTIYGETAGPVAIKHEFGHTYGLDHLGSIKCTATLADCAANGYKGSSPMGAMNTGLSAPELRKKGWFAPGQLVASPAPGTYTLKPLHAPQSVAGTRILEIPRTDGTWKWLFIAYRAQGTIDTGTAGVQLHRAKSSPQFVYDTFNLIDPSPATGGKEDTDLNVGASITDPASGVTITTVSADANGAVVRIT